MDNTLFRNERGLAQANHARVGSRNGEAVKISTERRFDQVLTLLFEAASGAEQLQRDRWDFAVEISELRRLGVTTNDLRWLICQRLVEHGRDVTTEKDAHRVFHRAAALKFSATTCFVAESLFFGNAREIVTHRFVQFLFFRARIDKQCHDGKVVIVADLQVDREFLLETHPLHVRIIVRPEHALAGGSDV